MLRPSLLLALLAPVVALRAQPPPILCEAIHKLIADENHWAYTQTTQKFDKNGKPSGGPTVERFDPSMPYDQQWDLIQYSGHSPSASEMESWRNDKIKAMKRKVDKNLGDALDLDHATLAGDTADAQRYLVPLRKGVSRRFPSDKLEVFMDVDKARHALRSFSLKPKEPFRIAGVVKVDGGEVDGRLEVVEAKYAPTLVWARGNGTGHVLGFFRIGMGAEVTYTEFKRVKPFNARFDVKIGDLKALNF